MKVEIFALCDFAKGESTGKLYVVGVFDHIFAQQTPTPLSCAIAVRLRFDADEQGTKIVAIGFMDSDGGKVIPEMTVQIPVQVVPGENSTTANVVVVLPQVNLPRFGEYGIDLTVDSRLEASIPLHVKPASQASPPPFTYTRQP